MENELENVRGCVDEGREVSLVIALFSVNTVSANTVEKYLYIYVTTPPRGFSGPLKLNGIGGMHVKAPVAARNGHE